MNLSYHESSQLAQRHMHSTVCDIYEYTHISKLEFNCDMLIPPKCHEIGWVHGVSSSHSISHILERNRFGNDTNGGFIFLLDDLGWNVCA